MPSGKSSAQLFQEWAQEANNGRLLTPKHDPNGVFQQPVPIRSVLSQELSASLEAMLASGQYEAHEYYNSRHSNYYYEIKPDPSLNFAITGYLTISGSQSTGSALDRMVIVSGSSQGWHVFAETSSVIAQRQVTGELVHQAKL
jgi:hypothetical protein